MTGTDEFAAHKGNLTARGSVICPRSQKEGSEGKNRVQQASVGLDRAPSVSHLKLFQSRSLSPFLKWSLDFGGRGREFLPACLWLFILSGKTDDFSGIIES